MSYYQTMYGTDDANTTFTDKDAHYGELVLRGIRDVEYPMLMCAGEKDAVRKALIMALEDWTVRKGTAKVDEYGFREERKEE